MTIGREDVPQRLYKYFPPERLGSLDNGMFRYTPLCAFNDPFEGRPNISELASSNELLKSLEAETLIQAKSSYNQLDDVQKSKLPFEIYSNMFNSLFSSGRTELLSIYSDTFIEMKRRILSSMDGLVGALCLTEEPTNILMWPHYAQNHEGFVIEFDAHHEYFHGERSAQDEFHRIRRVNYRRERPNLDFNDMNGIILFLVKSNDWSYENEWRLLKPLAEASKRIDTNPYPIDLFSFPRSIVKSIIFGVRASPETIEKAKSILASHSEYAKVFLKRAVADSKNFRLIIQEQS